MSDDSETTGFAPYSGPKPSKPGPSIMPNDADAARRISAFFLVTILSCAKINLSVLPNDATVV